MGKTNGGTEGITVSSQNPVGNQNQVTKQLTAETGATVKDTAKHGRGVARHRVAKKH